MTSGRATDPLSEMIKHNDGNDDVKLRLWAFAWVSAVHAMQVKNPFVASPAALQGARVTISVVKGFLFASTLSTTIYTQHIHGTRKHGGLLLYVTKITFQGTHGKWHTPHMKQQVTRSELLGKQQDIKTKRQKRN